MVIILLIQTNVLSQKTGAQRYNLFCEIAKGLQIFFIGRLLTVECFVDCKICQNLGKDVQFLYLIRTFAAF